MKQVTVYQAKTQLSALLTAVEKGEEVVVTRHGKPIARITAISPRVERVPGDWRKQPGWENFVYDPSIFAPMTEEEMKAEGWDD